MPEYFILYDSSGRLDINICAHAVDSVTKLLLFRGLCMYLPSPDKNKGTVILFVDGREASESEVDRFIRTLGGRLGVEIRTPDGELYGSDSPDNDTSFLESVPAPENEVRAIRLFFSFDGITADDEMIKKIVDFFESNNYEIAKESDGYAVYICANSFLDIFFFPDEERMSFEIDLTVSGAGVYAEVVEIAQALSEVIGVLPNFSEEAYITYTKDNDFDKLRKVFYAPVAQQLSFALMDDREGLQGYIGWGTDAFEPEYISGTVVTPFGRYDIDTLKREIELYGFSYVCDTRFLSRNTPTDGGDFYIREALHLFWNSSFGGKDEDFTMTERMAVSHCCKDLEFALEVDPYVPFPDKVYEKLCRMDGRECVAHPDTEILEVHYEPGYLRGTVCYGFGHYLRRFRLPGVLSREEFNHGEDVFFWADRGSAFKLECEISYGYDGDGSESPLGDNFAKGRAEDIEIFDIGGSSVVRFIDGGEVNGRFVGEAEIYIADEVYRFAVGSRFHDDVTGFREILKGCISVEDWYDEYVREEFGDPHANGATFCTNGQTPPCTVFEKPFPVDPDYLASNEVAPFGMYPRHMKNNKFYDPSVEFMSIEDFLGSIVDRLKQEDEEDGTANE